MEAYGYESDVRWRGLYTKAGEDGEIRQAYGTAVQEGECHASYVPHIVDGTLKSLKASFSRF